MEGHRVKLTEVNPYLVCVLCHGYLVDATTIAECLHSFCRSCIFRQLERKPICPICETQVHNTKLYRSLRPDKTLQDIVYKLVPGLFHNEMQRRRDFYKNHPYRDEHLEPECRGVGLDRLIYSPDDLISLSLEFYDDEREKEEWSNQGSPKPAQTAPSGPKRYLQCPAGFKMRHLKKFLRQKYGLSPTFNIDILYKRETLPDSYSLMDVAYIYTWKRNSPMRFYYRMPEVVMKQLLIPPPEVPLIANEDSDKLPEPDKTDAEVNKEQTPSVETAVKTDQTEKENENPAVAHQTAVTKGPEEIKKNTAEKQIEGKSEVDSEQANTKNGEISISKQDELPVSVLLSLGQTPVEDKGNDHKFLVPPTPTKNGLTEKKSNEKMSPKYSINKIVPELAESKSPARKISPKENHQLLPKQQKIQKQKLNLQQKQNYHKPKQIQIKPQLNQQQMNQIKQLNQQKQQQLQLKQQQLAQQKQQIQQIIQQQQLQHQLQQQQLQQFHQQQLQQLQSQQQLQQLQSQQQLQNQQPIHLIQQQQLPVMQQVIQMQQPQIQTIMQPQVHLTTHHPSQIQTPLIQSTQIQTSQVQTPQIQTSQMPSSQVSAQSPQGQPSQGLPPQTPNPAHVQVPGGKGFQIALKSELITSTAHQFQKPQEQQTNKSVSSPQSNRATTHAPQSQVQESNSSSKHETPPALPLQNGAASPQLKIPTPPPKPQHPTPPPQVQQPKSIPTPPPQHAPTPPPKIHTPPCSQPKSPKLNNVSTSASTTTQSPLVTSSQGSLPQNTDNKPGVEQPVTPTTQFQTNINLLSGGNVNMSPNVNPMQPKSPQVNHQQKPWHELSRNDGATLNGTPKGKTPQVTLNTSNGSLTIMAQPKHNIASPILNTAESANVMNGKPNESPRPQGIHQNLPRTVLPKSPLVNGKGYQKAVPQKNISGQRLNNNLPEMKNGLIQQSNINNRLPTFQKATPARKNSIPGAVMSKTGPTLDQRIQQLYNAGQTNKPTSPSGDGAKSESRLASWLNNRFKPQQHQQQPQPVKEEADSSPATPKTEVSVSMKYKRKLAELGKDCEITQENPRPEDPKRRRDVMPDVSIELMRAADMKRLEGGKKEKRPVPGLKSIQELGGKRKREEEVLDLSAAKPGEGLRPQLPWLVARPPHFIPRPS